MLPIHNLKRINLVVGMDPRGNAVTMSHVASTNKTIELYLGYVRVTTKKGEQTVIFECPRPELGWEYEIL